MGSTMLVQSKASDNYSVLGPQTKFQKILAKTRPILDGLVVRAYLNRGKMIFSPAMVPDSLLSRVQEINPDIIHLFWVTAGFLRLETIKKFKKPIVWTLHDMWPFTGGCHYDGECGKYRQSCGACPVLHSSNEHDLSRWIWKRKGNAWKDLDITVVATSQWLADCARSSSLFGNYRIEVLPNGIDETRYKPLDKSVTRQAYGLPKDKRLILFSAGSINDKRKGFQFLIPALQSMAKNDGEDKSEVVIIGASEPERPMNLGEPHAVLRDKTVRLNPRLVFVETHIGRQARHADIHTGIAVGEIGIRFAEARLVEHVEREQDDVDAVVMARLAACHDTTRLRGPIFDQQPRHAFAVF